MKNKALPTSLLNNVWVKAARPKTLWAGVSPVILGSALAIEAGFFDPIPALVCLLFAVLSQVGANFANDYFDHVHGTDKKNRKGFPRAVASGWVSPEQMRLATTIVLSVAFLLGMILVSYGGWWLLAVGVVCVLAAVAYTGGPYPLAYNGLGDVAVLLFYGFVPVMFTYYVQAHGFSWESFWAGLGCGLLATNILVVNNTRDIDEDAASGKNTLAVKFGEEFSYAEYTLNAFAAFIVPIIMLFYGYGFWVLMPMLALPLALKLIVNFKQAFRGEEYNKILAKTSQFLLIYSLLFALGILLN